MKSYPYVPSMVHAITVLTVLKMMTKAQTSCGSGSMNGRVMYERLPNIQLQGFDDDVVRDTAPPFKVLEKCEQLCLTDRASNNIVRTCTSFDFQPGSRIATYNGGPEYEESTCYLTAEQARPEGIGSLMLVPNSVHFTEVCLTSNRIDRDCPNRLYIFERHPRKKLKLPDADLKEVMATNRSECEDKCLNEFSFVCRSATFDPAMRTCTLSRFTRRTHPELLKDDPNSDYLENTCLNADRRCDGLAVFIKEENKRLGGPFEVDLFTNLTLEECQSMCVHAEKYFCRSIEYDEMTKVCTLSEEDSISQKEEIGLASSPTHNFYDFACLDSPRGSEYPDNHATSHLFSGKKPDTAFQRYRNSRLGGEHHSEISGRSLSECLDECLRQPSFQCKSAEYSERHRICRLTKFSQKDGMRIIYDADYDYYENLMLGGDEGQRPGDGYPGGGGDRYRPGGGRYPPVGGGRYPPSRYPPSSGGGDGYDRPGRPPYDRYPDDRYRPPGGDLYPSGDDRYPPPRPPVDSYPDSGTRYPIGPPGGDRYPGRYPPGDRDRYPYYPPSSSGGYPSRYPSRYPDKYGDRYGDRYPDKYGDRYPDKYGDRYPDKYDRYPDKYGDRYGDRYGGLNGRYGESDYYYGGSKYGGGGRYGGDRYWSGPKYGGKYDDRYGNRHSYYGDERDGGNRWFFRPDRRPGRPVDGGRPIYEPRPPYDGRPYEERPNRRPISPGPDGPIYDTFGGIGPNRPYSSRCDEGDSFKQVGSRQRLRREFVRKFMNVPSLSQCQRECTEMRDFICRSFNYRDVIGREDDRDNCELSDRDSRDLEANSRRFFDNTGNYDFYERSISRQGVDGDCLDVSQVCNEDGMEFTLRTPEGFYGRIYTYGFYDRCFFRGNGGTVNVLRISGAQGYPECGTQRYGDTMTNIVVVQFSDFVQTGRDKRFNLTCLFRGPGEAVVSSGFIGAGSGSPIPIEYLPAENTLSSKVRLMILYQGRPTTTIAVGDPLTFRLEAQDGYNYITDIFATNVVARDPYSGRSVQLIDRFGCPVDSFVFPELDRGRNGDSLEARFNAFKIPESNFLVFEATVRTCREGCQPAYCQTGAGRSEPSFGRKRRSINETLLLESNNTISAEDDEITNTTATNDTTVSFLETTKIDTIDDASEEKESESPEFVREMIEVFDSREELQQEARRADPAPETVCLTPGEYHGLVSAVFALIAILLTISLVSGLAYRKYWIVMKKNILADRASSNISSSYPNTRSSGLSSGISIFGTGLQKQFIGFGRSRNFPSLPKDDDIECPGPAPGGPFEDPSEPIYTDPSLFERSRSLRSIAVSQKRRKSPGQQI
ncbi:uncharacterized protein nompA isoform X2 [Tribolium castaneum]|uniref:No mechanoreceptor potential A n=1 Tax=Tribolium castaneum TaxID=7070 RepID=D6WSE9_TRICA|nr:PREDICTED: uncharacterized protein LOC661513 isoform X2 [Tribolium castaneum]EFA06632.2 hypothetical protein TcasGA2_TC009552 [Tribolium castaneum]|eukprot:XP_972761.1 PREDICTED: uncharacterized protein LOC661513 isoform X2 [Tribolium castaneum]